VPIDPAGVGVEIPGQVTGEPPRIEDGHENTVVTTKPGGGRFDRGLVGTVIVDDDDMPEPSTQPMGTRSTTSFFATPAISRDDMTARWRLRTRTTPCYGSRLPRPTIKS